MFKYVLTIMLMVVSQSAFSATCQSLIQQQLANQIENSRFFESQKSIVVVIICSQKPLPTYHMLYTNLMSDEQLKKTNTPMTALANVKLPLNHQNKTKATGFLVVNSAKDNDFTLRMRVRPTNGEALDFAQQLSLKVGQITVFEEHKMQVGVAHLGHK